MKCGLLIKMDMQILDLSVDETNLEQSSLNIIRNIRPNWNPNKLKFKVFTDGITNKLIGCWSIDNPDDVILVRIYGKHTDLLIDREEEKANFSLLHKAGYAPKLYATFKNGLAYAYLPGETITTRTVREISIYPVIAITLAKIHSIQIDTHCDSPIVWNKIKKFLGLVPNKYSSLETQKIFKKNFPNGIVKIRNELQILEELLSNDGSDIVFCHNDLLLSNIIENNGKVYFIDYEYAGWNYQAFDIGNHFAEFAGVTNVDYSLFPERDLQYKWLKIYLKEYYNNQNSGKIITEADIDKLYAQVNAFSLVSHIFWASWALVQAQHSTINFNFMEYAVLRMEEYFKKKNLFLRLPSSNDKNI